LTRPAVAQARAAYEASVAPTRAAMPVLPCRCCHAGAARGMNLSKIPIEHWYPPLSDAVERPLRHTPIPRTDTDDPARVAVVDRLCHCHPVTEQAARREIVDLAAEYHRVDQAWLMAQLRAWELAEDSTGRMARNSMASTLGARRDEILRKLRDKCRALGMRTKK